VPSFCVTHAIIFSSSKDLLSSANPDINLKVWAWTNLLGDAAALVAHFVIGLILLILIESDIFAFIRKLTFRPIPGPREDLVLDDDVIAEERRVANQSRNPESL